MATFTLDDRELSDLLSNIILIGGIPAIEDWLKQIPDTPTTSKPIGPPFDFPSNPNRKRLAYNGFQISFRRWDVVGDTVTQAYMQMRRRSSVLGFIENRRILKFLEKTIMTTFESVKHIKSDMKIHRTNEGLDLKYYSSTQAISPEFEIELIYEPKSEGQSPYRTSPFNDFIIVKFNRYL